MDIVGKNLFVFHRHYKCLLQRLVARLRAATRSNCGKPLKPFLPNYVRKHIMAKSKNLGYGKKEMDIKWAIRSQAPKPVMQGHGEGSETRRLWAIYDGSSIPKIA